MPATTNQALVHILDSDIEVERQRRAAAVRATLTRLFDELTTSVERECQLIARRREAASRIPPGEPFADDETAPNAAPDVTFPKLNRRTAVMAVLETLDEAGLDGLHGSELNRRVIDLGYSRAAVERAKQRLKIGKQIAMQTKTRIWTRKAKRNTK